MCHYVYKTINLLNGKYYIGKHSHKTFDPKYFGSGKRLLNALKKYGSDNFKIEVIQRFENEEEAYTFERQLVESVLADRNCYNLVDGGKGFTTKSGKAASNQAKAKGWYGFKSWNKDTHRVIASGAGKKGSNTNKTNQTGMFAMTVEQRSIWSKSANSNRQWITDGTNNKRIKKDEKIPTGWITGRTGIDLSKRNGIPCWTNGKINVFSHTQPSLDFTVGMTKTTPTARMKWWNNGVKNKRSDTCPGKSWSAGRLQWTSKTVTCPHCNKTGGETAMKRHHFDHCKRK